MKYQIVSAPSPNTLTERINKYIAEGFEVVGSHQVATIHSQNRFSGTQHMDTKHELEYSITMVLRTENQ
jgi:ketosteroid isomerase-like protein